jgi:guanine deaminase
MKTRNEELMREAITLSLDNIRQGNGGPFAALIVRDGRIISRGTNLVTTLNDPTAHAEVNAIREACRTLGSFKLDGCEIYTTCEPCPMCLGAIYWARIERIYYANSREDAARIGFDDGLFYQEVALPIPQRMVRTVQLMRDEAQDVFLEWEHAENKIRY